MIDDSRCIMCYASDISSGQCPTIITSSKKKIIKKLFRNKLHWDVDTVELIRAGSELSCCVSKALLCCNVKVGFSAGEGA